MSVKDDPTDLNDVLVELDDCRAFDNHLIHINKVGKILSVHFLHLCKALKKYVRIGLQDYKFLVHGFT